MSVKLRNVACFITALLCILSASTVDAQSRLLEKGEELFLRNEMEEARSYLESALAQTPGNEKIYLYLGTIYENLGMYEDAVNILRRGTDYAQKHLDVMYFNIANNMFNQSKNIPALDMYAKAIEVNPDLAAAYLNRANTALKLENYERAKDDYSLYLKLKPDTPQRENIERVLEMITKIVEEERQRRLEEERRRQEELARQRALLEEVMNSLENASEDTTNLSAETEGIEDVEEDTDIID